MSLLSRILQGCIILAGICFVGLMPAAALELYEFQGACPNDYRPLTYDEALRNKDQVCRKIGTYSEWGIFGLKDGGAAGGPGYKCAMYPKFDKVPVGAMLCTR